jgi:hypothetical protein
MSASRSGTASSNWHGLKRKTCTVFHQRQSSAAFDPDGGTLPDDRFHVLGTVVLCNQAVEARVNHLIDELVEDGKIIPEVGEAVRWLPTVESGS